MIGLSANHIFLYKVDYMKKLSFCCLAMAIAMLFASCATTKTDLNPYEGDWEVVKFVNKGKSVTVVPANLTIQAPNSVNVFAVAGNAGVNEFFGDVEITDGNFKAHENMGMTRKMGRGAAQTFEDAFMPAFMASTTASVKGDTLTISGENSKIVFERAAEIFVIEE